MKGPPGLPPIVNSKRDRLGKGLPRPDALEGITTRKRQTLSYDGPPIIGRTHEENYDCRKPKPGLLYQAVGDFKVDSRQFGFHRRLGFGCAGSFGRKM